ncbi:sigma-70 RNA polymerase sigma factor region 4 domain-containing protein [Alkaliphilus transvaalensis]|uniref:sigma-70 family RNA polymerase sigma factor n=1 Tax=Alkaliphilus transvaalensis TaxID=114628 RepID=UPI000478B869|nr:sigma-70 family RNA polymerase sigma factor [Alkaliphilus transvaalensis]
MDTYLIKGFSLLGEEINATYKASSPEKALALCGDEYGKLKKGYEIVTCSFTEVIKVKNTNKNILRNDAMEEEVIELCNKVTNNDKGSTGAYIELKKMFRRLIFAELEKYWSDESFKTKEEMYNELVDYVIFEFIHRFDSSKGKLWPYLRRAISARIKKIWSREKYVNAESCKRRSKSDDIKYYFDRLNQAETYADEENDIEVLKNISKEINLDTKLETRRQFFQLIVKNDLHTNLKIRQRNIIELYYGERNLTEKEIKVILGVTQQTINKTKLRAEKNILKELSKL